MRRGSEPQRAKAATGARNSPPRASARVRAAEPRRKTSARSHAPARAANSPGGRAGAAGRSPKPAGKAAARARPARRAPATGQATRQRPPAARPRTAHKPARSRGRTAVSRKQHDTAALAYLRLGAGKLAQLQEDFLHNDLNHDGKLTLGEFIRFMRNLDQNVTTAEIQITFDEIDSDRDGGIEFDEFSRWAMGAG
jgi:hypothetical protein